MTELAEKIISLVKLRDHVTFAELEDLPGFRGDLELGFPEQNIVLWQGLSQKAVDALNELRRAKLLTIAGAPKLVYLIDGKALALPLARQDRAYKKPHWAPVCFRLGKLAGIFFKRKGGKNDEPVSQRSRG